MTTTAPAALAFAATLALDPSRGREAIALLSRDLGPVAAESGPIPFETTDYYAEEMGGPLVRRIAVFRDPFDPLRLPEEKRRVMEIERSGSGDDGRRRVNVDPGYLTLRKVVLASRKDASHRILVADGVFAETTLAYHHGSFTPYPWTYADYRRSDVVEFFNRARAALPR